MTATKTAIAYIRASTTELDQPNSLAVQRAIVATFAETHGYILVREFFEYGSGCNDERAEWNSALAYAEANDCYILCWRVDRFSRSLASFARSSNVLSRLRFASLGDIEPSPIVLSVLIAAGQNEATNSRVRIKETMRLLKERDGRTWGNPRIQETAYPAGLAVRQSNAAAFNARIKELVDDLKTAGYTLKQCVSKLNNLGIQTRRCKPWTYHLLYRVINY
jgi:DNA invertase Pin-like site-specific DNA recombinase|tara:strand:+ start:1503 stop:2165 length:663 start_codon:yes stop_codon:yes gene_type:complete